MMLDKRPDLTRRMQKVTNEGETRKSLVEGTAESIQKAFTMCLTERTSNRNGLGMDGKPEGKKIGIYSFANMVLKLLFQCRKTQLANQIFTNIEQLSPPLATYPASQRVTFLFYLGRFQFYNTHYYSAQLALQAAYNQCHAKCSGQRRSILIYLISSNIILGRFPSENLWSRPETEGLPNKFMPICYAIQKGDIVAFKQALGPESGNEEWFFKRNLLLPLLSRCEVLVWRSLARQVFLVTYQVPTEPNSRKAPTLDIEDILTAAQYAQRLLEGWSKPPENPMFVSSTDLVPPSNGPKQLGPSDGVIFRNKMPDALDIEAIVASMVQQDLLHGFISHGQGKFAIIGAKQRGGPLNAGFPPPWETIKARAEKDGRGREVPGWVQAQRKSALGGVVNLSGIARAVGSGG